MHKRIKVTNFDVRPGCDFEQHLERRCVTVMRRTIDLEPEPEPEPK